MRLAIDAMGGDYGPEVVVKGAVRAVEQFADLEITLVGNETKINPFLTDRTRINVIHTETQIMGDEEPVRAVRRKKDSSMVLMAQQVKDGKADACISAGNTGALMTSGLFVVGRIRGIDRPALAPTLPTIDGKGFVFLDVGANADAKPEHLLQYAYMGSIYAEKVRGIKNPTVGLLNIGTESKKGNDLTRKTYALLEKSDLNFIGNVEARDLLNSVSDVVVTDGFTGNMVLKSIEGSAISIFKMLKETLLANMKAKMAAALIKNDLGKLKQKMDYSEYGGACLFGLKAPVVKAHGSSDEQAIFHAIRQARDLVLNQVPDKIIAAVSKK
ncbi:phosphate acyltransferase PlsX [Fervidibacillus albus]|uniref:Phosphate acyltransferase n=1 Tax=Fervidibacillus albus TaxID=2980026 RepID=A0A9E8RXH3_9BACI|nr:phosphate acyltransferase PlsX [Fervidibacillus albus]WAA11249.1 phosphate acyltransferase PlsX [Fervidibacillus albus]